MASPVNVTLWSDASTWGGGERYLETLATGVDRSKFRMRVVLSTSKELDASADRLASAGTAVARVPAAPTMSSVWALARIATELVAHRPTLLHANLTDPRACNAVLAIASRLGIRRIVTTEHLPDSPFDHKPTPWRHKAARKATARAIALTDAGRKALIAQGMSPSAVRVVANGLADPGAPSDGARRTARAALGIADGVPVVGWVGRLEPQKDPDLLLDVAKLVSMMAPTARIVVVGDGSEAPRLRKIAHDMGLDAAIVWLGWRKDAAALLSGMDALLLPSKYEGMPMVVIEAMAVGLPVVARRIPGLDELVDDGTTGWLVKTPPDAPRATIAALLAAAVCKVLRDRPSAEAMKIAARRRFLERFTDTHMLAATQAVWTELLA